MHIIILIFLTLTNATAQTKEYSYEQNTPLEASIKRGREIYNDFCSSCHLPSGKGIGKTYPPLAPSDYLMNNRTASIKAIKYGLKGEITVNGQKYNGFMAPMGLDDNEIADVMNYITNSWAIRTTK